MPSVSMELVMEYWDVILFSLFATWVLIDFVRLRKAQHEVEEVRKGSIEGKSSKVLAELTVVCSILISILYLGFCVHGFWTQHVIPLCSAFSAMSWILATLFAFYCKKKGVGVNRKWPFVLVAWWLFSSLLKFFSISAYLYNHWSSTAGLPDFFPAPSIIDFTSFPLSAFLCFGALFMSHPKTSPEVRQPLLSKEEDASDGGNFSNAGLWSRLTFRWLNPVFEKGWAQRLELCHVPAVPPAESAEKAYLLLEESIEA